MRKTTNKTANYINHIVFVIDSSGSMDTLTSSVVSVFDNQVAHLSKKSQELNQETRASVYLFDTDIACAYYDKDVMRLPSLKDDYHPGGGTALIDGTMTAVRELKQTATLHGDHAFLVYVITDGEENSSAKFRAADLKKELGNLPDNWTVACLVPNSRGTQQAMQFGFTDDNILTWDATVEGLKKTSQKIQQVTDSYMANRAVGIRGTKSLFRVDTASLASRTVSDTLDDLKGDQYYLFPVSKDSAIREFVESRTGKPYAKGSAYYQLTKPEDIQDYKQVAIQNRTSGKVWVGPNARTLLGLPNRTARVGPESGASKFNIFVQSTSVNRKLVGGTSVLVIK